MSSYIDLILILLIVYFGYQGYKAGIVTSLYKLLFVLVGILFSLFLAFKIKGIIYPGLIASPYLAIGIITLILLALFRMLLQKGLTMLQELLEKTDLIWMDPILGAILGIIKCYVLVFIVISFCAASKNRVLMNPILKSPIAVHIYNQVRRTTGINLASYLSGLSIKHTVDQVSSKVSETAKEIETTP